MNAGKKMDAAKMFFTTQIGKVFPLIGSLT